MKRINLALLSGLLLICAFPPVEWSSLAFIALIPLLFAVEGRSPAFAFALGWIAGLAYFTGVVWWVTNSIIHYGHLPRLMGWAILFLMTSILALYPGIFAMLAARFSDWRMFNGIAAAIFLAAFWTALEWLRGNLSFLAFPWANLAYSQYRQLAFIQTASLTGPYGPTFCIVLVNAGLYRFIATCGSRGRSKWPELGGMLLAVSIAVVASVWGMIRLDYATKDDLPLKVAVIQGNISQDEKWDRSYQLSSYDAYDELTRSADKYDPDLVVWPETAAPFYYQDNTFFQGRLSELAKEVEAHIIFGAPAYVRSEEGMKLRNRVYMIDAGGRQTGWYDKLHLVPFGEYVPLKKALFFAGKLVQEVGDFTPGEKYHLFDIGDHLLGAVICYEIIFPDLVRRFAGDGATLMVNVTNDAWFGETSASWQHFTQMVFRAVENDVPVARAANTGISGFIDRRGHILSSSELFIRGFIVAEIRPGTGKTLYSRWGDFFAWFCLAVTAMAVASLLLQKSGC